MTTFEGHTDTVNGILQLEDGRILSWSTDKTLRIWDIGTGECLTTLGHTNRVDGAKELKDGRILSWSNGERTVHLWDTDTGKCLATINKGHAVGLYDILELEDGRILSWGTSSSYVYLNNTRDIGAEDPENNIMRLWDVDTGKCLTTFPGHTHEVKGVQRLEDGRILSWSRDKTLRLWDTDTGECLNILEGHIDPVMGVSIRKDGRILSWSVSWEWNYARKEERVCDHTLRLWDVNTGKCLAVLDESNMITKGAVLLDNGQIWSWSGDESLRLWDTETGQALGRWNIDEAALKFHDLWYAYQRINNRKSFTGEAALHDLTRGIACIFPELKSHVVWQADAGEGSSRELLPEGIIVVGAPAPKYITLHHGNHRVTLAEAEALLKGKAA